MPDNSWASWLNCPHRVCRKVCAQGCEDAPLPPPRPPLRVRHNTWLTGDVETSTVTIDPLTCDSEVWRSTTLSRGCDCQDGAEHVFLCPASPIYLKLCDEMEFDPAPYWWAAFEPWPVWSRMRVLCSDGQEWHVLGEINGPDHWCEREKRVVYQGE